MARLLRPTVALLAATGLVLAAPGLAAGHPSTPAAPDVMPVPDAQHGTDAGHLLGSGAFGDVEKVSSLELTQTEGLVADVAVSPDGQWAFLANWGEPDCAGPEQGGQTSPDAGAWVVSLADIDNPRRVGFIPSHQDTRPGEGMQVVEITTKQYSGDVLVMNNERCGKNGKGGISLWDVTDPLTPVRIQEAFGDRSGTLGGVNSSHSAFAWDAGDRAYLVAQDSAEFPDVDIFDITNPKRPRLIAEYDLNDHDVDQPGIGLTDSDLHDMTVKRIGGDWILLASYWDGGYVQLNVNDPANAVFLGDTDFTNPDPELLESTGASLTPEGNAHQAEFTADNQYFIATDEDFAPYRTSAFTITSGPHAGVYPSVIVPGAQAPAILPDLTLNGPVVYGGYGCPDSAAIPTPASISGYVASLAPGEEKIVVLQRGPAGDPSATEPACFPGEKAHEAVEAGWDAVVFVQRHTADDSLTPFCGSGAFVDEVVGICTSHGAYHRLFDSAPLNAPWTYPDGPAIGTIGADVHVGSIFDGWGYVHLYDRETLAELDTYAIPQAHDPAYAFGFGDLTVHEVATSQVDTNIAYYSYYAGGFRVTEIQGSELVEVGGYLDPGGNNFWGVEAFSQGGVEYVAASDRDHGLWIFRYTGG